MATTICDITAFDYWRIPPIVRLLLVGEEDDATLRKIATPDQLRTLRSEVVETLPLCNSFLRPSPRTRHLGASAKELLPVVPILAVGHEGAVDVLIDRHSGCHSSTLIRPRLWTRKLPLGSTVEIYDEVCVASPELAMLQLAARASLPLTIMMASELCGSFAVHEPLQPIKAFLQRIIKADKKIPTVNGWKPFVDASGNLGNLWSRPPLTTPHKLAAFAADSGAKRGVVRLVKATELLVPNAASPLEVQTAMLLGLPSSMGGYGIGGFEANRKVRLNTGGRLLSKKSACYCDLFWEEAGIDVECQSTMVHQNADSFLSDSERTTALRGMGLDVLPITFDQLSDSARFDSFVKVLVGMLGLTLESRTEAVKKATVGLRTEVLAPWETIHHV